MSDLSMYQSLIIFHPPIYDHVADSNLIFSYLSASASSRILLSS